MKTGSCGKTLIGALALAAIVVTVAACGGGNDSTPTSPTPPPTDGGGGGGTQGTTITIGANGVMNPPGPTS